MARLGEAVAAYRAVLEEWTRERVPLHRAARKKSLPTVRERVYLWYGSKLFFPNAGRDCAVVERIEKTVFLSYRRTNIPWAIAIFQNLTYHAYDVFFDYKGIGSGDFEQIILGNIAARGHFLVLLTPSALERCDEPNDWLRREIETALSYKRNIVPLMLEGFDFSMPEFVQRLTGTLAPLKHYNGLTIPPAFFDEAMERLRRQYLTTPLSAVLHPVSSSIQNAVIEQKAAVAAAPAIREKELTDQYSWEREVIAKWGINFKQVYCPRCGTKQPRIRLPRSLSEAMWGGNTCPKCGTKMDKWGRERS